ncbi:MAG: DUF3426 domain-containing protein [Gammaproteobacteria bacterium]
MTYTTRCPACGTTFRVVPDQLKISDGWVRCGHCSDVFDATLTLQPWSDGSSGQASGSSRPEAVKASSLPADSPLPAPSPVGSEVSAQAIAAPEPGLDSPTEDEPMASGWEDSDFMAELHRYARQTRPAEAVAEAEDVAGEVAGDAAGPLISPRAVPVPERATAPAASVNAATVGASDAPSLPPAQPPPRQVVATNPAVPEAEPSADAVVEPGFVVQARRRAFWSSAGVRVLMLALVLVLGVLLAGQWALHERDAVAARWPGMRPVLAQACEHLGCQVAALQRIDDVVIDSSTLQRRLGNFYAFDLVLKNRADVPLAVPALELSLTDLRDQVIARRVFLPQEMPGMPAELPARGSVSTSLRLSIALGNDASMSGFRALVFYP